ncbi:MAG: hypothetical protein KDD33_13180 [Bdellovibrionales bacterium]|nr:hypothetical protein [Bdellovibrionales bacterium]
MEFLRPAKALNDKAIRQSLRQFPMGQAVDELQSPISLESYLDHFYQWIGNSQRVRFSLSGAWVPTLVNGTTEAFFHFYLVHSQKRLIVCKGEYPFHRDCFTSLGRPWSWYQPGGLQEGDFAILSLPFSGNGGRHPQEKEFLQECEDKNIPLLIDLSFLGLGASVDLSFLNQLHCLQSLCFSFSKQFNIGRFRIGLHWTKDPKGPLEILRQWNYHNWFSALVTQHLMENFSFDYLYNTYRDRQLEICQKHNLEPSDSILFGLDQDQFPEFSRDGFINRLCISPQLTEDSQNE